MVGFPFFHLSFVCRVERSSDQVIKPVNLEALTKWVGNIPEDVVHDMANIAPMLSILGENHISDWNIEAVENQ